MTTLLHSFLSDVGNAQVTVGNNFVCLFVCLSTMKAEKVESLTGS